MADKAFSVKDINLIGASGTPTIESPNNLNINAVNVAISTDITVAGKVSLGAGTSISSPAANVLTLGTDSEEKVRIDSGGRVNISDSTITNDDFQFQIESPASRPVAKFYRKRNTAGGGLFAIYDDVGATETRQFNFASGGNLTLDNGNLVIGTSGQGIDFSATSDAAGMTSELLDDYEEGTFTPTLRGSSAAGTATGTIAGRYIKIGHFVHVSIRINNVNFSGSTGAIRIDGLPYAVASTSNSEYSSAASHMFYNITFDTNYKHGWYVNPGSSSMYGIQSRSGQVWQDWASSNFHASSIYMNQTITYMAA